MINTGSKKRGANVKSSNQRGVPVLKNSSCIPNGHTNVCAFSCLLFVQLPETLPNSSVRTHSGLSNYAVLLLSLFMQNTKVSHFGSVGFLLQQSLQLLPLVVVADSLHVPSSTKF